MTTKTLRLSFKKEPRETGLRAVGHPYPDTIIKVNDKWAGTISAPSWRKRNWTVGLMVTQHASDNCSWGWKFFDDQFATEPEARQWLKDNWEDITSKFTIHAEDDE